MSSLESMLGFASKAGQLMTGSERVEKAIKKHQVRLVICAQDLSPKTLKSFKNLCDSNQVDFYCFGTRSELGRWIGAPERGVVGVVSNQFAAAIRLLFNDWGDGHK
jgi:ribosomal protein L7Ae-like RNA K-turn-binding protein